MDTDLKELSQKSGVSYSNTLWRYIAEDFLWRMYITGDTENLWLRDVDYPDKIQSSQPELCLFFVNDKQTIFGILNKIMVEKSDVEWKMLEQNGPEWKMQARLEDKVVEFMVKVEEIPLDQVQVPQRISLDCLNHRHKVISLNAYSVESVLGENLFEIIEMLELISDMEAYGKVYHILSRNTVSGRYIMEELQNRCSGKPQIANMRRLDQLQGYRDYAYMRKKWNSYRKKAGIEAEWTEVVDKIVSFLAPLWTSLCENEVFFDDWMPELGRYLG